MGGGWHDGTHAEAVRVLFCSEDNVELVLSDKEIYISMLSFRVTVTMRGTGPGQFLYNRRRMARYKHPRRAKIQFFTTAQWRTRQPAELCCKYQHPGVLYTKNIKCAGQVPKTQ